MNLQLSDFEVRPSLVGVAQNGLFCTKDIAAGEVLLTYDDQAAKSLAQKTNDALAHNVHLIETKEATLAAWEAFFDNYYDDVSRCNVIIMIYGNDGPQQYLVARCRIPAGTEIMRAYSADAWFQIVPQKFRHGAFHQMVAKFLALQPLTPFDCTLQEHVQKLYKRDVESAQKTKAKEKKQRQKLRRAKEIKSLS